MRRNGRKTCGNKDRGAPTEAPWRGVHKRMARLWLYGEKPRLIDESPRKEKREERAGGEVVRASAGTSGKSCALQT